MDRVWSIRVRTRYIVTEPFGCGMEVEAVGLQGEFQAGKVASVSGGRREVATKYFEDFEDFFFGVEYFVQQ